MKKSLLALAVLSAIAGTASAQSSVTLSGGVDVAVQRQNGDWNMSTGNSGRTNFTLSGREDLGGGMYAFFALNYRFNAATGQSTSQPETGRFFRQSWAGLGGGFGDVRLGRMLPVLQEYNGGFDPFGTETIGSTHTWPAGPRQHRGGRRQRKRCWCQRLRASDRLGRDLRRWSDPRGAGLRSQCH